MTKFEPNKFSTGMVRLFSVVAVLTSLLAPAAARAGIDGLPVSDGSVVTLTASEGYVSIADGGSIYSWGYSNTGTMQLPGTTLILTQGDTVTVTLNNNLPAAAGNTSIVFPGHQVTAIGGVPGQLTREAPPGGSVSYTFTASEPGTYQYHSGTRPELQVEMGLYGAIVVRPTGYDALTPSTWSAYNHAETDYDREYLFLLSEIDIDVHRAAEQQAGGAGPIDIGLGPFHPEYWLLNGRAGPDTMAAAGTDVLPSQPYNSLPRMHPGERLLLRVVGAGRDLHPFHTHGNHVRVLARDGRMLLTDTGQLAGPLLFTIPSAPGSTVDAVFEWTGKDLGWDIYGHAQDIDNPPTANFPGLEDVDHNGNGLFDSVPMETNEWAADHGRPIPVELPAVSSLAFGGFYSGSPYLGALGSLPPGEGGLNPNAGFSYMWHSHAERELVNNDVFPGGMMTMLIIEAPSVDIIE
jgi:FtsP/CotA-like multicopper oxidase with cupredoxin domain